MWGDCRGFGSERRIAGKDGIGGNCVLCYVFDLMTSQPLERLLMNESFTF